MSQNRVPQGVPTGGQFTTGERGESTVDLGGLAAPNTDPYRMSRDELLADLDIRFAPKEWLAEKSDHEIATMIAEMRAARLRAEHDAAEASATRHGYRRPSWLTMSEHRGQRNYSTPDGFSGRELVSYSSGRPRTVYAVSGTGRDEQRVDAEVERVEDMVAWIEEQRAARAETWREAFPVTSPAATVAAFRGQPVRAWFDKHGTSAFIDVDGGYVGVCEDQEPTGYWFIEGQFADGASFDGGFANDKATAQASARRALEAGPQPHEEGRW